MELAEGRPLGLAFGRGVAPGSGKPAPTPASGGLAPAPDAGTEGAREVAPVTEPPIPILEAFRRCRLLIGNLVLKGRLVGSDNFRDASGRCQHIDQSAFCYLQKKKRVDIPTGRADGNGLAEDR